MIRIEEFVDSMKPRNAKERKKLINTISHVGVRREGEHYLIMVPKGLMGIPYEGDLSTRRAIGDMLHSHRMNMEDTGCE